MLLGKWRCLLQHQCELADSPVSFHVFSLSLSLFHSLCAFFILLMLFFHPTCPTEKSNLIFNKLINACISDACRQCRIVMWLSQRSRMTKVMKNWPHEQVVQPLSLSLSVSTSFFFYFQTSPMQGFLLFFFLKKRCVIHLEVSYLQ